MKHFPDVYKAQRWAEDSGRPGPFRVKITGWYGTVLLSRSRFGSWNATETGRRENPQQVRHFKTKTAAVKYAKEHGAKTFSIRKIG